MKKLFKSSISLLLVCLILSSFILPIFAATTDEATHTSNTYGKNVDIFYVNANNKKTTKLNYSCTAGSFIISSGSFRTLRGYYEVLIYGRNSTSESWNYLSKTNIKNASSTTISMSGYTQYKVRVYSWNTATIGSYRGGIYNSVNAAWWKPPTCTFTAKSNVASLAQ